MPKDIIKFVKCFYFWPILSISTFNCSLDFMETKHAKRKSAGQFQLEFHFHTINPFMTKKRSFNIQDRILEYMIDSLWLLSMCIKCLYMAVIVAGSCVYDIGGWMEALLPNATHNSQFSLSYQTHHRLITRELIVLSCKLSLKKFSPFWRTSNHNLPLCLLTEKRIKVLFSIQIIFSILVQSTFWWWHFFNRHKTRMILHMII